MGGSSGADLFRPEVSPLLARALSLEDEKQICTYMHAYTYLSEETVECFDVVYTENNVFTNFTVRTFPLFSSQFVEGSDFVVGRFVSGEKKRKKKKNRNYREKTSDIPFLKRHDSFSGRRSNGAPASLPRLHSHRRE